MSVCVCVLATVILHINRTFSAPHYILICSCLDMLYFSTLSHKLHDLREEFIAYKRCGLIFYTYFV